MPRENFRLALKTNIQSHRFCPLLVLSAVIEKKYRSVFHSCGDSCWRIEHDVAFQTSFWYWRAENLENIDNI